MRRTRLIIPAMAAALLGAAAWWLSRPVPVAVAVHEVGRGTVESSISNTRAGEVEACQRTRLSTIVGGRIDSLPVREGDRVEAGQVLMRLWNADLDARLAVNRAQLDTVTRRVNEACTLADNAEREAEQIGRASCRERV